MARIHGSTSAGSSCGAKRYTSIAPYMSVDTAGLPDAQQRANPHLQPLRTVVGPNLANVEHPGGIRHGAAPASIRSVNGHTTAPRLHDVTPITVLTPRPEVLPWLRS